MLEHVLGIVGQTTDQTVCYRDTKCENRILYQNNKGSGSFIRVEPD